MITLTKTKPLSLAERIVLDYIYDLEDCQGLKVTYKQGESIYFTPYFYDEDEKRWLQSLYTPCFFTADEFHEHEIVVQALAEYLDTQDEFEEGLLTFVEAEDGVQILTPDQY